jgi:ABC-type transport system substrate-binding protein
MTMVLIIVIVILAAGLIGTVVYFMTRPGEVTPPPGEFEFSNLVLSAEEVDEGDSVTVSVDVTNTGETEITGPVTLLLNDVVAETKDVTLAADETETVTFTVVESAGTYEASIYDTTLTDTFTVIGAVAMPSFVEDNKLVFESGATYQWLDPHVSYYQYDYWIQWHSVEMLLWYEMENASKVIPWLAEDYAFSDDMLQCNLTLRQDITFQDGHPFNATAVWFSFNRLFIIDGTSATGVHGSQAAWMVQQLVDPDGNLFDAMGAAPSYNASWVQDVLDLNFVEILDSYKIRLNMQMATTQFLPILAGPWAAIISPWSTIEMDYEHGGWGTWDGNYTTYFGHMAGNGDTALNVPEDGWKVGTGAYYIDLVDPATYDIVLKAYTDYWGGPDNMNLPPEGKDRIETIEFIHEPSFSTRLLHLKAGTATGIQVPTDSIFQVVDRDRWIEDGVLESIVSGATMHGVYPQFTTWWLDFNTNVTNTDGSLKEWQPFADWRIRMAVACSVNMTHMNIYVNNRLGTLASNIVPPGTFPEGSYNTDVEPAFSYNLTRAEWLLNQSRDDPLTSATHPMHFYNGSEIPAGVVDNTFGTSYANAKVVELYVQTGADTFIQVLTTITDSLNAIANRLDMGIQFRVVIVPGGHQYTLASLHRIDGYVGGWICDYNHVLNWLQPMYVSTGTYPSWNLWNITKLDDLYAQALEADQQGNFTRLLEINDEMNTLANDLLPYMVWWYPTLQLARSNWLHGPLEPSETWEYGWYVNTNYGVDLWSNMYYEEP